MAWGVAEAGVIWDGGGGGDRLWGTANNWDGNSLPTFDSGVSLEFGTAGDSATLDKDYVVGTILFNRDAAFTINRSGTNKWVLTLHSGISTGTAQTAGRTYTLTTAIALGDNNVWMVNNPAGGGTNSLTHGNGLPLDLGSYQLTVDGAGNTNLNGAITGATGSLYKSGSGTLSIGHIDSTFAGGMTVANGTVGFNDISVNGASAGSGPLSLIGGKVCTNTNGGGVTLKTSSVSIQNTVEFGTGLVGNRELNFTGAVAIADGAVLNFSNVVDNVFSGVVTLQGNVTMTGSGAGDAQFGGLALGSASRQITVDRSAGTVAFGGPLGGDTPGLDLTIAGSAPGAKVGFLNTEVTDAAGKSPVRIVVNATGTVTFDSNNTYSGGTLIQAGTVKWTGGNVSPVAKGPFGTGTLTIQGGTLANFYNGGGTYLYNAVHVAGGFEYATLDYNRMLWFRGPVTFSGNPTVTHNGNMGTSSDLVFDGTVQLQSNVAFAGTHTGSLEVISSGLDLGGVGRTMTFDDVGTGPTADSVTSVKSTLTGTAARLTINGSRDLEASFDGGTAHSVEYGGTATYTLKGVANNYTGGTFVSGGATVKLSPHSYGGAQALPTNSSLTVTGAGSIFDLADWGQDLGSLTMTGGSVINSFAGSTRLLGMQGNVTALASADTATISCLVDLKGATRTFTVANGAAETDLLVSGIISKGAVADHAGLNKQGAGRLVLSGTNTFDLGVAIVGGTIAAGNNAALGGGSTTVQNGGELEILAGVTISNPVTVEAGGTVGGAGTYLGNLSMPAGSFLDPGSSPGTFTVDGNLTATPGSTLLWELGDNLAMYDRVDIKGGLILPGHGAVDITIQLSNPAGQDPTGQTFTFVTWAGADPVGGTNWGIDYGTTGWSGGSISGNGTDLDSLPGGSYQISGLVPEPATVLLLGLGLALLRRRRAR
jgi:autotransporter-associated beta strand protein